MEIYNYSNQFNHLYISGDIHGEFRTLVYNLKRLNIKDSVVIVAGDCGIGFEKMGHYEQLYKKINKSLTINNCIILLVRGNHDDPRYFEEKLIDYPRMKTLPDYSVVLVASRTILCIGGAISVDRYERLSQIELRRLTRKSEKPIYWENEYPVYKQDEIWEITNQAISIDTIITHTAPTFCYPKNKIGVGARLIKDETLVKDIVNERETVSLIYNQLIAEKHMVKDWFYGHFHTSHTEFINGIRFSLLDIDELKEPLL